MIPSYLHLNCILHLCHDKSLFYSLVLLSSSVSLLVSDEGTLIDKMVTQSHRQNETFLIRRRHALCFNQEKSGEWKTH